MKKVFGYLLIGISILILIINFLTLLSASLGIVNLERAWYIYGYRFVVGVIIFWAGLIMIALFLGKKGLKFLKKKTISEETIEHIGR